MADNKQVIAFLSARPEGATLSEIAKETGHGRATVGKYLEILKLEGKADYRGVGRAKVWVLFQHKKQKILIVDDEPGLRRLLKLSLGDENYELSEAEDGIDALKKVSSIMPDLILLDLRLPKLDGMEVCKRLRENILTKKIRILMLTAKDELQSRIQGIKTGADDYITKPFDILELKERVNALLEQSKDRNQVTNLPTLSAAIDDIKKAVKEKDSGIITLSFENLETYGRKNGKLKENELLKVASQILAHATAGLKEVIIAHLNEQEFIVLAKTYQLKAISSKAEKAIADIMPYIQNRQEKKDGLLAPRLKMIKNPADIAAFLK
jgi:two-component system, OmpR family, alkaline phosphatase synthesis response regulator PhoP